MNADSSPEALEYLRKLVYRTSAIVLEESKGYLFQSRLLPILRREGLESFDDLVGRLDAHDAEPLRREVVEAMTTNETSFFRDLHPFEALRRTVLPEIAGQRKLAAPAERTLSIWSAACSTGQELYSIAFVVRDMAALFSGWTVELLGTDISSDVLARAQSGRYSQLEVNRGLPAPMLIRYFTKAGLEWQVSDQVRAMVDFRAMNLCVPWPRLPLMDVIFLRNVLIYFDNDTRTRILERVARQLRPGGYLFLGGVESASSLCRRFTEERIGRAVCFRVQP